MSDSMQGFLSALDKDRYDATTRLIFADWLEEKGLDDEALEQRRRATPDWIEADKWLHDFAKSCGQTCVNYSTNYRYTEQGGYEQLEAEQWKDITYEDVLQAGHDFLREGFAEFVQVGSDQARDLFYYEPGLKEQFWKSWQTVTGVSVEKAEQGVPFSCTC